MKTLHAGAGLASAVAIYALAAASAAPAPQGSSGLAVAANDTVHCYGVNSCKGTADCATASNACKGQNACEGQGFKGAAALKCLTDGGVIGDLVVAQQPAAHLRQQQRQQREHGQRAQGRVAHVVARLVVEHHAGLAVRRIVLHEARIGQR